jgi:hypothetical protein
MSLLTRALVAGLVIAAAAGCAGTKVADHASSLALDQLGRYEADVNGKVRVESDYYDQVMDDAVRRIARLREDEQDEKLTALVRGFAERHQGSSTIDGAVADFLETALRAWADRDASYEALLASTQKTLAANRRVLEVEQEKVRQLKTKLRALSEPQTVVDMLKLAVAFSKEVKVKYDAMQKDADGASAAAAGATKDAVK